MQPNDNQTPADPAQPVHHTNYPYQPPAVTPAETPSLTPTTPPEKKQWWHKDWRSIGLTVGLLLLAPIIAWLISAFAIQSYQVEGESMENTLQNGDRLLVDKVPRTWSRITGHAYVPQRGDIVIFNTNQIADALTSGKQLIKRVVGLPGERIIIRNGNVTVYNSQSPKGFNPDTASGYHIDSTITIANHDVDYSLKNDELFVLGDNRSNSEDSRFFGAIKTNYIVGKLSLRLLPLSKVQRF